MTDPARSKADAPSCLQGSLRPRHFFTIGLGAIIGVGWAIMIGQWLIAAAPLGAMLGFALGATVMLVVAACYAELAAVMPLAGGDVVYVLALFGRGAAFISGWFLVLMATSMMSFEAISLAWFADKLFPGTQGRVAYVLLGSEVRYGALGLGTLAMGVITLVNYLGATAVGRFQDLFTYLKAAAVVAFVTVALMAGHLVNMQPLWTPSVSRPVVIGIVWIAATAPVWYGGFQVIPQAVEERAHDTSLRTIGVMTVLTVGIGLCFYWLVILASTLVVPWRIMAGAPLPAAMAIEAAFSNPLLAKLVLGLIVLGILATWNACFLWATRLLLALGREDLLPRAFARTGRFHSPGIATLFVGGAGLLGLMLGRSAVVPIINMASISLAFSYLLCCLAVLRLRRLKPDLARPFRVPLGTGAIRVATLAAGAMAVLAFLEPLTRSHGIPLEWVLMLIWSTLGIVLVRRRRSLGGQGASRGTPTSRIR